MQKHYNINQLSVNITTHYIPQINNVAWFINDLVESIKIEDPYIFGRPRKYDLTVLLKLLLFAYCRGVYKSRDIELLAIENLSARWLTREMFPSYRTICRFRASEELDDILNQCFENLAQYLRENNLINNQLCLDGTKLLADANKYSFVWRKNTVRYDEMNRQQITELLQQLRHYYDADFIPENTPLTLDGLEEIIIKLELRLEDLEEEIKDTPKVSPNPAKQERRYLKSQKNKLAKRQVKIKDYLEQFDTYGERNSYSRTDKDATFMRMKEDHMLNGQLKPGFNLQALTSNQFFLGYDIFSNPTDTRTFIPMMEAHKSLINQFNHLSADAGYGSESNYQYLEDQFPDLNALIPYGTMLKEVSKKWQTDDSKVMNWEYHEKEDYYIDNKGIRFNLIRYETQKDKYHFERQFKVYEAEKYDENHQLIPNALTPKGYTRKIKVNPSLNYFKAKQREKASLESNQIIYGNRKIDVEPAFGHLKASLRFTRLTVRGKENAKREIGIALMASNIRRLAAKAAKKIKIKTEKQVA